jgi:protein-disulfide isomerase
MATSRRALLTTGLAAAGIYSTLWYGAPAVSNLFAGPFDFEPVDHPAGFRKLAAGASTSGFDPFVGFSNNEATEINNTIVEVTPRLCETLYDASLLESGVVPIASFSDYNCPFCKVLTQRLAKIEAASSGRVKITWHELPLLGETSLSAARAALAAKRQNAYVAFHKRLVRAPFQTTNEYIEALASEIGVDVQQLRNDMASPEVDAEIRESTALSRIFGFVGTPALVVGRTIVQGQIGDATLERLIKRERADGPMTECT